MRDRESKPVTGAAKDESKAAVRATLDALKLRLNDLEQNQRLDALSKRQDVLRRAHS